MDESLIRDSTDRALNNHPWALMGKPNYVTGGNIYQQSATIICNYFRCISTHTLYINAARTLSNKHFLHYSTDRTGSFIYLVIKCTKFGALINTIF